MMVITMTRLLEWRLPCVLSAALTVAVACAPSDVRNEEQSASYDDLIALFDEWRVFQRPQLIDGAPDYSADAMAAQFDELPSFQRRLQAIDLSEWPLSQQVDYHIVRAEMNGLEFDHRVLHPWARNPAFYRTVFPSQSDVPAREGPVACPGTDRRRARERRACSPSTRPLARGVRPPPRAGLPFGLDPRWPA